LNKFLAAKRRSGASTEQFISDLLALKNQHDRQHAFIQATVNVPSVAFDLIQMVKSALERAGQPHSFSDAIDYMTYWFIIEVIGQAKGKLPEVEQRKAWTLLLLRDPKHLLKLRGTANASVRAFLDVPKENDDLIPSLDG
jgi:hypothetical protein